MLKRHIDGLVFGCGFALLLLMAMSPATSGEEIKSLTLWKSQAKFFIGLGYPEEDLFKEDLKKYYQSVYSGVILQRFSNWIDGGSLESEYYSSFYGDLEDTVYDDVIRVSDSLYEIKSVQESCYDLNYNPPIMETIVSDYKVTNYSQKDVNTWLWESDPSMSASACLKIAAIIEFKLDGNGFIFEERKKIISSILELRP